MAPLKRFIRRSLIAHIIVLIVGFIMSMWQPKTNFIVFGAHSRYDAKPVHHTLFAGKRSSGFGGGTKKQQIKSGKKSKVKQAKKAKKQTKKTVPVKKQHTKKPKKSRVQETAPVPEEQEAKPKPKIKRKKKRNAPVDTPIIEKQKPEPEKEQAPEPEPEPTPEPEQDTVTPPELETDEPEEVAPPELETDAYDANEPGDEREDNPSEGPGDGFSIEGEDDPAALARYQKHVQHEIDRVWRPPVGVPQGTLCTVQFIVADDGSVASCTFITRSKVLIYDLSIMRVATQLHFNKSLWGKRFVIGFKQ